MENLRPSLYDPPVSQGASTSPPDRARSGLDLTCSIAGADEPASGVDRLATLPGQIGRYYPLALLGAGGMGVVYAAYDPDLDRKVALKLLHPERSHGAASARLLREAQAQARISHPNVVQIHDTGMIGEELFLAMEFVPGVNLRAWLAQQPRSFGERLQAFLDAGRGLAAAHAVGLVHRDFKPENVLVGVDGRVRVADFGLAREHGAADPVEPRREGRALDLLLTAPGDRLGTPAYMSPEQHLGLPVDARSDQFSFCVALWEALHGVRPFAGKTAAATAEAVIQGELVAPPNESRAPREIEAALRRGLAREPAARFPDMHALLTALGEDRARKRRQRLLAAGLGATGVAGGLALALAWGAAEAPCSGSETAIAASWDPERRAAVADALRGAADPELPTRVLASLDAHVDAWTQGHRDACMDHRRGEQSSALFDARVRCLERRRKALDAAVTALRDEGLALDAAQIVARLPAPAVCSDPEFVLADTPAPEQPELARAVEAVEAQLDLARARHNGGDLVGSLALAESAVAEARRLGHRSLLAEALLCLGTLRMNETDMQLAHTALGEALAEAIAARRDDVAAEAHARKLYIDGIHRSAADVALDSAPLALALAGRAPEPHAALGLAYNNIGAVHDAGGDREAAMVNAQQAIAEMTASPQQDPIELGNAMFNAAMSMEEPEPRRALVRRAVEVFTTRLGPRHRMTLDRQQLRAQYEPDPRDGLALLAEVCPHYFTLERGHSVYCGECWHDLGHFAALLGDPGRAVTAFEQVAACQSGGESDESDVLLRGKATAARALLAGEGELALTTVDELLRSIERHRETAWMAREFAQLELLRGRALLLLDRPAQAVEALERAIEGFTRECASRPAMLPRLWLAHSQAELAAALRALPQPQAERAAELERASAAGLIAAGAQPG